MSDAGDTQFDDAISHKLSGVTSSGARYAEGGESGLYWGLDMFGDTSEMTYRIVTEGGPGLALQVRVRGCSRVDQHLTNHRSAWKNGQRQFVSFLEDQERFVRDLQQLGSLQDLRRRTERLVCPVLDSAVFNSVLVEQEDLSVKSLLRRSFVDDQFEQEWIQIGEEWEPSEWEHQFQDGSTEVAYSGEVGRVTLRIWSRDTGQNTPGLGEYTISSEGWAFQGRSRLIQRNDDDCILVLHLDQHSRTATLDPRPGSTITVRLAGMTIDTPNIDWDQPFYPENGYLNSTLGAMIGNDTFLTPTSVQLPPLWVGQWSPTSSEHRRRQSLRRV